MISRFNFDLLQTRLAIRFLLFSSYFRTPPTSDIKENVFFIFIHQPNITLIVSNTFS